MKMKILLLTLFIFLGIAKINASDRLPVQNKDIYKYFYDMVLKGNLDSVKYLLKNQAIDLLSYDEEHNPDDPVIFAAIRSGNIDMVRFFVDKGIDLRVLDSYDETVLHCAAEEGSLEIARLLIKQGVDADFVNKADTAETLLYYAAKSGNLKLVKYLIKKKMDVNSVYEDYADSPISPAAYMGHYDMFMFFASIQPHDFDWQGLFHDALTGGNPDIVKYVVEKRGVDVNKKSEKWNEYPIETAVNNRFWFNEGIVLQRIEIVKYLVSKGARLDDIDRDRIFYRKCLTDDFKMMADYLDEQGLHVTLFLSRCWTPLAMALDGCDFELAKRLLEKTDDHTFRGQPLIVFFADDIYTSSNIIAFLIEEGINKDSYTEAFVKSVIYDNIHNARLFLNAGVDISDTIATNSYRIYESGANILHYAKSESMLDFLIKNGADIHNEVMLKNAWRTPSLLHILEEAGIFPFISHDNLNKILSDAAELGDIQTLEYALKRGAAVNSCQLPPANKPDFIDRRIYKQTPLIKNAIQGYRDMEENHNEQVSPRVAEILLNAGADPNLVDADGKTALHYIAGDEWVNADSDDRYKYMSRRNYEESDLIRPMYPPPLRHDSIMLLLIQNGADLNIQDKDGRTPLISAAINDNYEILKMLFEARADIAIKDHLGRDAFSYLGNLDAFCTIKEAGLWNHISQEHLNAAFCHYFKNDDQRKKYGVEGLKTLISLGANVNTKLYNNSTTALIHTFNQKYGNDIYDIAQVLIDSGIDLYSKNESGCTVLTNLIKNANLEKKDAIDRILFLINNGIDLNHKSENQFTALGIALCRDKKDIADLLILHGAKRDRESEWWCLVNSSFQPDYLVTKLQKLVEEGVSVDLQSPAKFIYQGKMDLCQEGITALMIFSHENKPKMVNALIQMGADVNLKTSKGTTALDLAYTREMKEILLQAGAEITKDK